MSTTMKIHSPVIIEYIAVKYGSFLGHVIKFLLVCYFCNVCFVLLFV